MKALRFVNGELKLDELEKPAAGGESLVRVTLAGVCNTDLEIVRGYANFNGTLGHEFVGVVEESEDRSLIGSRVVGEINAGCGECELCQSGDPRHCLTRTVLGIHGRDGAFAEYLRLPAVNLLKVPDSICDRRAVFAEPLAAACEILDQVAIDHSHKVAVIGDGKLGQLIARVLAISGCELVMIGKHDDKLDLAKAAGIVTIRLDEANLPPASRFDFVVEASGSPSGFKLALDLVRPRGSIVLKSTFHGGVNIDASRIVVDEITVVGSRCGRFESALELLGSGKINVDPLIVAEFGLKDGVDAMDAAKRPGSLKVLLKM